jgi:hypothetical protein
MFGARVHYSLALCMLLNVVQIWCGIPRCHAQTPRGVQEQRQFATESFKRPYGPRAPWNVPIAGLRRHPESDHYAQLLWQERLWEEAAERHDHLSFKLSFEEFTYPVYDVRDATGQFPVECSATCNMDGENMPWNPDWQPASGSDAQVIVLDYQAGREWNLYQARFEGGTIRATRCNLVQGGLTAGEGNQPANFWLKENGFIPSRGIGIQYLAMLARPEEIAEGKIRHALSMPIRNVSGQAYVSPATKLEHPGRGAGIPEGMRFAIEVTDDEIETWISSLPAVLDKKTRQSAKVIARTLRDYGWFITDTSGRAHLQFEDRRSAGAEWDALGLGRIPDPPPQWLSKKRYPDNLLDGLVTEERIYALAPADAVE